MVYSIHKMLMPVSGDRPNNKHMIEISKVGMLTYSGTCIIPTINGTPLPISEQF